MKRICVYCGSSPGSRPEYARTANLLGQTLARKNIELVYGGSAVGLMGAVAQATMDNGGKAIGVIPRSLNGKVGHEGLTELHITETMHERKNLMFDLSDGFVALPGGIGTMEELFEILTWAQLGFHEKPCGFLNVCGYYDNIIDFIKHAVDQKFVRQEHSSMILVGHTPDELLDQFSGYTAPKIQKWIDR